MTNKISDCCCCWGCINNGSLVPACIYCGGSGTAGGVVPLFYEVDLSWIGRTTSLIFPPCCPAGLGTNEQVANTGACSWVKEFACYLDPSLIQGRAVLTVGPDGSAAFVIEINFSGTTWTTIGLWRVFGPWQCLCANWVYLDLEWAAANPPPPGCQIPLRICIRPVGDCCANERPPHDPMPPVLYAVFVNEEQCANLNGFTIPLTWNPVAYEFQNMDPTPIGADCVINYIKMRCTNFQGGGCASWEMDLQWFRPGVGTTTILAFPAATFPDYQCACYPFDTKFVEILNNFPCCAGPVGTGTAFAPRLSIRVVE